MWRKAVKFNGPMPWISPHKCHHVEQAASARAGCAICKMSNGGGPLAVILQRGRLPLAIPAAGSPPSPRGGGGGRTTHRHPSAVVPAPKAAAGSRERAGGAGRFLLPGPPPRVTSTEVEARAGCIYPQRLWPGRGGAVVRCRSRPGPLHPRKHAVVGRSKGEIPLSTSIHTQKYTPWAYIFEPLLNPLPRRGRQPGARGRAACPPARPHSNPLHPPHSLKQITGCATES
jgi:hypothetical protein